MLQEVIKEIENTVDDALNEVHTALPGKIVSYNPEKATCTARPIGKYVMSDGEKIDFPDISDAPVCFPYSLSGVGIAFPVKAGDSCLIIISEIELDEWDSDAESEMPLKFDLTSAIVIPGLMKNGNALTKKANQQNAVVVKAGDNEICISKAKIAVSGVLSVDGDVICSGDVKAGSTSLKSHTHTAPYGETSVPH